MSDLTTEMDGGFADLKRARRQRTNGAPALDRLPPHALEAEQGLLGCCLLAPTETMDLCIDKIGERAEPFYDLRHATIWEHLVAMWDAREAIDVITLQQRLRDRQLLEQIGGLSYLNTLQEMTPSAANVTYYADIVAEKWFLRRTIHACTGIVGRAYEFQGEVDNLKDQVERDLLQLLLSANTEGFQPVHSFIADSTANIEALNRRDGTITGLSTGFADFDRMTDGLHGGEMIVIAARPGMGKAQPLDAQVLTPWGFQRMGDIHLYDWVIGADGKACNVIGVYPQGEREVFEVTFSDGTKTKCCNEHLWFTQTRSERRRGSEGSVKSLDIIRKTLIRPNSKTSPNHVVPTVKPVEFHQMLSDAQRPLNPWLLGALLGDGTLSNGCVHFSKPERDVQDKVRRLLPSGDTCVQASDDGMTIRIIRAQRNNSKSSTKQIIDAFGLSVLSSEKFIPEIYLRADPETRFQLLCGLLDTDGYVTGNGTVIEFATSSQRLANDVAFLARSLGAICSCAEPRIPSYSYKGEKLKGQTSYRMNIWFEDVSVVPVTSEKHLRRWRISRRHVHKSIVSITPCGMEPCQCIAVDSKDHLYVTDDFIVTHNTSLAMNIAEHVAVDRGIPVGVFSMEMTSISLTTRMIASRARVNLRNFRNGFATDADYERLTRVTSPISRAPLFIDDTPALSVMQLRSKARKLHRQENIRLFVVDYMQLAHSSSRRAQENRQQEISEISGGIKALAKELNVPIIVLSQLNRELEKEKNRKPRLSDLRESGAIEQDADLVGMLYKPSVEDDENQQSEEDCIPVNLLIAKQRNGPTGDVNLVFLKSLTRFESAARVSDYDVPTDAVRQQHNNH